jgi:ABC-2 type transport system ATP-binding protein
MIDFIHTTKLYGSVIGVNDITLELGPGAYGLLGPNGSGKTTLLNLITGQLRPTLGELSVFGEEPWNNQQLLHHIGLCPAQEVLYSNVSGYEWVRYLLRMQGFHPSEASRRAEQSMERVGMKDSMGRWMGGYSKGMRQRTKLAQAIAHEPALLVLDEPFNGLDPIGRHDMTILLREWIETKSLILASHILHEVEAICPSFLLILGGRLLASGTSDEVHVLLAGIPCDIIIRCDNPTLLSQLLIHETDVQGVRRGSDGEVIVSTRDPASLNRKLPQWANEHRLIIHELQSPDDTLQTLFNSLMKAHRGETQ